MTAAGFAYYIPNRRMDVDEGVARDLGLGYAIDAPPGRTQTSQGPDGGAGCIFGRESVMAGDFRRVHWEQIESSEAWVCMIGLPGPADLTRPDRCVIDGQFVQLGQHKWLCPKATAWGHDGKRLTGQVKLPEGVRKSQGVWVKGGVVSEYRRVFDDAMAWLSVRSKTATDKQVTEFDYFGAAARALSVNYYIGETEISLLGIFDERSPLLILDVLVDSDGLDELAKKGLLLVPSSSGSGSTDSIPSTSPQLQTCG